METEIAYRIALGLLLAAFTAHRAFLAGPFPGAFRRPELAASPGAMSALFPVLGTTGTVLTILYLARPDSMSWASLPLPAWLRWAGLGSGLAGLVLLHASQRALGDSWSPGTAPPRDHGLVTAGPYRWVRHPIYTALLLVFGGTFLLSANGLVGTAWLAVTGVAIGRRVRREEERLLARFGQPYEDYVSATGRFLPRLRKPARERTSHPPFESNRRQR